MRMPETAVVVALLVGLGLVLLIALLVLAARSRTASTEPRTDSYLSIGMSLGMLIGAGFGTIAWILTDEFVFWVIFMGAGLTIGIGLGSARAAGRQ
jgi:hypothetical protein